MLMRRRLTVQALIVFIICAFLIVVFNVYFLHLHSKSQKEKEDASQTQKQIQKDVAIRSKTVIHSKLSIVDRIQLRWQHIHSTFPSKQSVQTNEKNEHIPIVESGVQNISSAVVWKLARSWVGARQVYPSFLMKPKLSKALMGVLHSMATFPITRAEVGAGGTQLKMTLTLKGEQKAVFKPMRYSRDTIFTEEPYAGADRHNGEIVTFHLSRLLDVRWVPLTVGRKINLRTEILPVAERSLKKTFFKEGNGKCYGSKGNNTCFYGVCYYCKRSDPACGVGPMLEGAVILWLPLNFKLKMFRHPWRRLYKKGSSAPWEVNEAYCYRVKNSKLYKDGSRLLDLIDIAVVDFLIGNADRHRYEVLEAFNDSMVLLLDNGKSFGNPYADEITILAPLYQCCQIRRSMWEALVKFSDRSLSASLLNLLNSDPLHPLLTDEHLLALDRRRLKVLSVIEFCFQEHENRVLVDDL